MAVLCIDTITSVAGITLVSSDFVYRLPLEPMQASEGIIESIDNVLKKLNSKIVSPLSQLTGVMVIKGPGSFTGLRVGISVANQLAHQLKIPVVGLRTDEWWRFRMPDSKVLYLQSMNRAELYCSDHGHTSIVPFETLCQYSKPLWCGELKFDHLEKLPADFSRFEPLDSIESAWQQASRYFFDKEVISRSYDLVEPFYGKEPNITKPKKIVGMGK